MQIIAGAKDPLTGKQPQAASEAELRLSLRQAIEARDVADAAARDAKEVADKPDHLARRPPMKRRSSKPYWLRPTTAPCKVIYAVAEALKAGRQPPVSIPAPGDSEHLASASAYHHVLEFAAGEL